MPDELGDTDRATLAAFGNAVSPPVSWAVGRRLRDRMVALGRWA